VLARACHWLRCSRGVRVRGGGAVLRGGGLRQSYPGGFALDQAHTPHITVLQRYVRTANLGQLYEAVGKVIAQTDFSALSFRPARAVHIEAAPEIGLAGIALAPSPAVLDFQARLFDAAAPFTEPGGTAAAYVTDAAEPDISQPTLDYIEHYVPDRSGPNYFAHITAGLAKESDLAAIEAEPVEDFTVHPAALAVYHLGNNCTART